MEATAGFIVSLIGGILDAIGALIIIGLDSVVAGFESLSGFEDVAGLVIATWGAIGLDDESEALVLQQIGTDEEHEKRKRINPEVDLDAFLTLIQPSLGIKQLYKRLWESVAAEHLKLQAHTSTAKKT